MSELVLSSSPDRSVVGTGSAAAPAPFSRFEFWPTWLMYLPVAALWLWLGLRHRSLTLPLLANPGMFLGGMVGDRKSAILALAAPACGDRILPWFRHQITLGDPAQDTARILARIARRGWTLPLVCKPDLGCRGSGVKLVRDAEALCAAIATYPIGAAVILQQLASYEPEVGLFYVRPPGACHGRIVSLTDKSTPSVIGDGRHTLAELVAADPRAGRLAHLYHARNAAAWERVLPVGERHRLLFSASHCRGAVFTDLRHDITAALEASIDALLAPVPGFHFGRLDVKYRDRAALRAGAELEIIEINGVSSEAIHIWDRRTSLREALTTLLWQCRTLFAFGAMQRARGHRPPPPSSLLRAWLRERRLSRFHPETD